MCEGQNFKASLFPSEESYENEARLCPEEQGWLQTFLTPAEQHTGLELGRLHAEGKYNISQGLVCGITESSLIFTGSERSGNDIRCDY